MRRIDKIIEIAAWIAIMIAGLLWAITGPIGCATPPRVHHFKNRLNITVIVADGNDVERACSGAIFKDDGEPITFKDHIVGCWLPSKREIWVDENRPKTLLHELAHADGMSREEAGKIHWE